MEGHCPTGQSPQWAVVPMEEEVGNTFDCRSRGSSVGIPTSYGQDGPVFESRQGREIASFITVHTFSVLYFNGFGRSFLGYSSWGVTTTRFHPASTLRMSGSIRLLPLYALVTWTGT